MDILKINLCEDKNKECSNFEKAYNQMYLQYPEKLRIYQGYLRCENLSKGIDFDI